MIKDYPEEKSQKAQEGKEGHGVLITEGGKGREVGTSVWSPHAANGFQHQVLTSVTSRW